MKQLEEQIRRSAAQDQAKGKAKEPEAAQPAAAGRG
jgi:hypothetical protein